jgi:hypothetical protein
MGNRKSLIAGAALVVMLAACSDTGGPSGNDGTATLRLMHTASGTTALDLLVGGQLVAGGIQYEQASDLATVPGGLQTLSVRRSGEQSVLGSKSVTLTAGATYSLVVSGSSTSLVLTPSEVVDTGLAKPDRANIRLINVSTIVMPTDSSQAPPAIPLAVYISAPGLDLGSVGSQLSLDARISSYSSLMYFNPGTLVVRFVTPGTTTVVAETAPFAVAAGQVRAVTLQRLADGTWKTSVVAEE